jgi:cytochrome b involved in lipid metabolism
MLARDHGHNHAHEIDEKEMDEWTGPKWTEKEMESYIERNRACVLLIDGYVIDVTGYMKTHVHSLSHF